MTRQSTLRPVSDIITELADIATPHVAQALRNEPWAFHKDCPCPECMRAYLRAVEAPRGPA